MSYGLFPKQQKNPDFMEAYKKFLRTHYEEYSDNAGNPSYALKTPNNTSDRFLIYMPTPEMFGYFTKRTQHFIIYVDFDTTSRYYLSPRGKVISNPKAEARYLPFSFDSPYTEKYEETYKYVREIDYDTIDPSLFITKPFSEQSGKFSTFNAACVHQLQPEHYHYFAEFFQHFVPFQKMYPEYRQRVFKSTQLPKNTLLN